MPRRQREVFSTQLPARARSSHGLLQYLPAASPCISALRLLDFSFWQYFLFPPSLPHPDALSGSFPMDKACTVFQVHASCWLGLPRATQYSTRWCSRDVASLCLVSWVFPQCKLVKAGWESTPRGTEQRSACLHIMQLRRVQPAVTCTGAPVPHARADTVSGWVGLAGFPCTESERVSP